MITTGDGPSGVVGSFFEGVPPAEDGPLSPSPFLGEFLAGEASREHPRVARVPQHHSRILVKDEILGTVESRGRPAARGVGIGLPQLDQQAVADRRLVGVLHDHMRVRRDLLRPLVEDQISHRADVHVVGGVVRRPAIVADADVAFDLGMEDLHRLGALLAAQAHGLVHIHGRLVGGQRLGRLAVAAPGNHGERLHLEPLAIVADAVLFLDLFELEEVHPEAALEL